MGKSLLFDVASCLTRSGLALSVTALAGCYGGDGGYCGYDAFGNPICQPYPSACGYDAFGNPVICPTAPVSPMRSAIASANSFAVAQALANAASQAFSFTVASQDQLGNTYTISYWSTPGPAGTFDGVPAATAVIKQVFYQNGVPSSSLTTTKYFDVRTYQQYGSARSAPAGFQVVTTGQAAPASALVGQNFALLSAAMYRDASKAVLDGSLTETLSVEPDTGATGLVCLDDKVQPNRNGLVDGLSSLPTSICLRIDPTGNLLGLRLSVPVNGIPLTFR